MSRFLDLHNFLADKLRWQLQLLHDTSLSAAARLIGAQLMHDLNSRKRHAYRSQHEVANLLGLDVRTVRRGVAELKARGHLETRASKGRGHAIEYEALLKEADAPAFLGRKADISAALEGEEKRTNLSRKAGAGAPPILRETLSPLSPQSICVDVRPAHAVHNSDAEAAGSPQGFPGHWVAVPSELRCRVLQDARKSDAWAGSYLDAAAICLSTGRLHPASGVAKAKLEEFAVRRVVREAGFDIGDAMPLAQLARLVARSAQAQAEEVG